ncbi:hypothetical protein [uncultured Parabacteroides sp.]|uniref:hypothetical protein n=1 Tax=uncultured Parabacteroides sp. TaxID=512312 RepID=UPI0025D7244E|nr:hypothetical protein [uncultured Parabacteroides sp.]
MKIRTPFGLKWQVVEITCQLIPIVCRVNGIYLPGGWDLSPAERNYLPGNCRQDRCKRIK